MQSRIMPRAPHFWARLWGLGALRSAFIQVLGFMARLDALHDGCGLHAARPRKPLDGGADLRDHDAQAGQALLQLRPDDHPAHSGGVMS